MRCNSKKYPNYDYIILYKYITAKTLEEAKIIFTVLCNDILDSALVMMRFALLEKLIYYEREQ